MGLGITGLANAGEMMGHPYASGEFMQFMEMVLRNLRDTAYDESAELAKEKGPFPLWDWEAYSQGKFIMQLPPQMQHKIQTTGIRNSHLTSIAPTGTISLTADNVSSGIEPPFALFYDRTIEGFDGQEHRACRGLRLFAWHQGPHGQRDQRRRACERAEAGLDVRRQRSVEDMQCG